MKKRISDEEKKVAKDLARLKREYKKTIRRPFLDKEDKEILQQVLISTGAILYAINFAALFATDDWKIAVQQLDVVAPIIVAGLSILSIVLVRVVLD